MERADSLDAPDDGPSRSSSPGSAATVTVPSRSTSPVEKGPSSAVAESSQPRIALPPVTTGSPPEPDEVTLRISTALEYLKKETFYLAGGGVQGRVQWSDYRGGHRLCGSTGSSATPAVLSIIARIDDYSCRLVSDGFYKGPTEYTQSLAAVKMTCLATKPTEAGLGGEYDEGLRSLESLINSISTPGRTRVGVLLPEAGRAATHFKLRHVLFRENDQVSVGLPRGAPSMFRIDDWPVNSPSGRKELGEMKDTHTVVPLRAYDENRRLIPPTEYLSTLRGALVVMEFTVGHWVIGGGGGRGGRDTYVADIHSIKVLARASCAAAPADKHTLEWEDPEPCSLRKKQKTRGG